MFFRRLQRLLLRILSYFNISIKKYYKFIRHLVNFTGKVFFPFRYKMLDYRFHNHEHDIEVRLFTPAAFEDLPVIIYFHGGGWVTGNIDSYTKVCANLAKFTKHRVLSVDYRLAPENKFPAGLEDCYFVTREILNHSDILGLSPDSITIMGDSAGGNLAAAVSLMLRDNNEIVPKRQILIYPSLYHDHEPETSPYESVRENAIGNILTARQVCDYIDLYKSNENDLKSPYFAPLLANDFSNQPDTLIITAQHDPLRDEGEEYGRRLLESGNRVTTCRIKGGLHGFFSSPPKAEPRLKQCYKLINEFIRNA